MEKLFDAIEKGNLEKVKELFNDNDLTNIVDHYGYSALQVASSNGEVNIACYLIEMGIDVNYQDKKGYTILHYAAEYNQLKIAQKALENGANLSISDFYGNEPLWTAIFNDKGRNDRIEIIKLFLENGADVNHKNKVGKSPKDIVFIAGYKNMESLLI